MKTFMIMIMIVFVLGACAPASQKTLDLREERAYDQQEREIQFDKDTQRCDLQTHMMAIDRRLGHATRNQVVRNVPGRGDKWYCVRRTH